MTDSNPEISVIFPVFNERDNLAELLERITGTLQAMGRTFEILAVDDGSTDGSFRLLKEMRRDGSHLRILRLVRNYGQSPALYAGFANSRGDIVVTIDADLQNYPEDIPKLVEKLEEGYEMVSGWRSDRQDSIFRSLASRALNQLIARISEVPLRDCGCSLKAFRRELVNRMGDLSHRCRFLPVDVIWLAGDIAEVEVRHDKRAKGKSRYGLIKLIRTAFDLFASITALPLQIIGLIGWLFSFAGFAMALRVAYIRLAHGNLSQFETIMAILFFLGGVQLMATGIMCEYIGRIYVEAQRKPYYVVREEI